jgi:hypothetical protein
MAGRPRMVARRPAHVAKAPPFCPDGVVVKLKWEIVTTRNMDIYDVSKVMFKAGVTDLIYL